MEAFLQTYGYWAVLIGTFLEGETILVLGGLAAHLGYMNLTGVILAAFAGSLCGDQFFFFLGRHHSTFLLTRRPSLTPKLERANRLIDRFQTPLILGFRFLYGLRTVMPFAIGVSKIPVIRFFIPQCHRRHCLGRYRGDRWISVRQCPGRHSGQHPPLRKDAFPPGGARRYCCLGDLSGSAPPEKGP